MRHRALFVLSLLLMIPAGLPAAAQEEVPPDASGAQKAGAAAPPAPTPQPTTTTDRPLRDPTVQDARFGPQPSERRAAAESVARDCAPTTIPLVALRGLVSVRGRAPAAVLEIGGVLHHVAQGSQVTWVDPSGKALVLDVASLTVDEVRIAIPSLDRTVVVR